jgi:ribokinase
MNSMSHPPRICVVGSSNMDVTFRASRLPTPGETLAGRTFQLGCGGKGANQAVMAARLGAQVTMVSRVGGDVFGRQILDNFRTEGIDTTHVRVDASHATGAAAIVVDDAGQNSIIVVPGANYALTPEDVRAAAEVITQAQTLICQLEVPAETTLDALRSARRAGVRTIFNPAPVAAPADAMFAHSDFCVPNESELQSLSGQPVETLEQIARAAEIVRGHGARVVIVTLGERGALIVDERGSEHVPAEPVQAVDTSGAGDAFIGSLAVFLGEGVELREAVRRANHVAALTVTRPGTQASFPGREYWLNP